MCDSSQYAVEATKSMDYSILATSFTNFDNDTLISCGEVVQIIADLDPFEEDETFSITITSAMFGDTMLRVGSRFMENYTIYNPPGKAPGKWLFWCMEHIFGAFISHCSCECFSFNTWTSFQYDFSS